MTDRRSGSKPPSHLYVVAGYPTSGKSSCLWKSAQERNALWGKDNISVLPKFEAIRNMSENIGTKAKLEAGLWCTLGDIPYLNEQPRLPERLILHLDLLLVYLLFRAPDQPIPKMTEMEAAFGRFFAQPAIKDYEKVTVTNLRVPLEEIQRRWRYRYRAGKRPDEGRIMAEKHRLIMDEEAAGPVFTDVHATWGLCLASLARSGKLAGLFEVQVRVPSDHS